MPLWSGPFQEFTPPDIPGLIAWYDSNSTVLSNDGITVLRLRDKYIYRNDLISFRGASNISNAAVNLLPNTGSITASNIGSNFVFSNAVMTSTRGTLEFQNQTTGATVFVCGDFNTTNNNSENYLSVFTNNYSNPSSFSNHFTVGTVNRGGIFSNYFVNVYDTSNIATTASNLTPIVVGWFDPNRNIATSGSNLVGWSNLNRSFSNQDMFNTGLFLSRCNTNVVGTNAITVLSNNSWTGASAIYGCNAANVLNVPYSNAYTNVFGPYLTTNISNASVISRASFIRAVGFVINVTNNSNDFIATYMANMITATYADSNAFVNGTSFRTTVVPGGQTAFNKGDLFTTSNPNIASGTYGGGLWVNGSNVFNPLADNSLAGEGYGAPNVPYDLRNSLNIVFLRFGEALNTGIGISGLTATTSARVNMNFYGQIGDIIVLGSNYTTQDQYNVEGYLAQKYNLLGRLISNHPFKSGYAGRYPFGSYPNSILTGIAFNNNTTVPGFYTTGYLNGFNVSKNSNLNIMTTNRANFNMFLGDSCNYTAKDGLIHNINTTIKEVIVYNNPLSSNDVNRVHKYLQTKYRTQTLFNNGSNFAY